MYYPQINKKKAIPDKLTEITVRINELIKQKEKQMNNVPCLLSGMDEIKRVYLGGYLKALIDIKEMIES